MSALRKILFRLGLLAALAYLAVMVLLVTQETRLIFAAGQQLGKTRPSIPWQEAGSVPGWVVPAAKSDSSPWVIYFHGKGADIASGGNIHHYEQLRGLGLNVLAPEYTGFGGVIGEPSEAGLNADAMRAYLYLRNQRHIEPKNIVLYGWSLGSAVAVTLASKVEKAAVILEGAPASVAAIGQHRYPVFPVRLLIHNPFESIERIGRIGAPVLFLHSPEDQTVPISEARRLFEAAPQPRHFVEVAGGHNNASRTDPHFFPAIHSFLRDLQLLP